MFITEYVTQEDINKFKLDELLNRYQNTSAEYKHHWVVDKETGNWLLPVKKLNNFEAIWILYYKNTNIEIKLYKTSDRWDLTSIASNSLNNQEIIECIQSALRVLGDTLMIWAVPKETNFKETNFKETNFKETNFKETNFKEKKEIEIDIKKDRKRKISYLDILTAIIVAVVMFYIANDRTNNITSILESDHNKTSKKTQTTKPIYDIYSVLQTSNDTNAIYGINHNKLETWTEILSLNSSLSTAQVDNYGNIYWADRTNKAIYKANPDGTNIRKIITVPGGPSGLAIDNEGERIFWSQWLPKKKYGEIGYADLSGNNKEILVSDKSVMHSGAGMFYDYLYDKLYVSDASGGKIIKINLKTKEVTKIVPSSQPADIVVDYKNKRIIWTDTASDKISSADLDGSNKKVLIQFDDQLSNPVGLTIDTINERLIYEYSSRNAGEILETSNLDGTEKRIEKKILHKFIKSLFFVNNSNNHLTSKKTQTKKSEYNTCVVSYGGIYLTNSKDLNTLTQVVNSNNQLMACSVNKYGNVFWVDRTNEGLYKANSDGTDAKKILPLPALASGLAIDNEGERIFSAQWNKQRKHQEIISSDFDGNNKTILFSNRSLLRSVNSMFYDNINDKLYVSDSTKHQIISIDLKTKELKKIVSSNRPRGIVVDYQNERVIWTDSDVYSVNFDGSDKKILKKFNNQDVKFGTLTIDTTNNRLIHGYLLSVKNSNNRQSIQPMLEISNLDGTQRTKKVLKNQSFDSVSFFNSNFIVSEKVAIDKPQIAINKHKPYDVTKLKKCFACHAKDWSKSALGKSAIVKNMSEKNIYRALKGYKNGSYGGPLKDLMKDQVSTYSDKELKAIAQAIKTQS